ncbi:MAG: dihydrolipoamide acetyltransferase family protein, partial [Sphingobium sp.]
MALHIFTLPDIGEGIAEAEVVAWHVAVGDYVEEDQRLADMMTDKATVEMESPVSGRIVELAGDVGTMVPIGSRLVVLEIDDIADIIPAHPTATSALAADVVASPPALDNQPQAKPLPAGAAETGGMAPGAALPSTPVLASPAVRARAQDLGIDLAQVKGTGPHVRHADLDAYLSYRAGEGYLPPHAERHWKDEAVRVIGLRRRIAQTMQASKQHIPHFTYVEEIDVTRLEEARSDLNGSGTTSHGDGRPHLTLLPFLIVALCRALPAHPMLNARYDDKAGVVMRSGRVHLGIATQTEAGLMVPVIRDAQDRNIWQL